MSPQGILHYVQDSQWMVAVREIPRLKIIHENHDVLAIGHVCLNKTMDHIKCCALCPFGPACQQVASSDDVATGWDLM